VEEAQKTQRAIEAGPSAPLRQLNIEFWDGLLSTGVHGTTLDDVIHRRGVSYNWARQMVVNAEAKGVVFSPVRGLYVIIPPEHRSARVTPAMDFINLMMEHLGASYYVSGLSAAAHWGSSHQASQEFHVVADRPGRVRKLSGLRLRFFVDKAVRERPTVRVTSATSMVRVASRETTAFDLVERADAFAGLSHVATVLAELEGLDPELLAAQAPARKVHVARRLGWLLERSANPVDLGPLHEALVADRSPYTALDPGAPTAGSGKQARDRRWRVLANSLVEPDEF
jgi:predicted transcriptional regulator of viral defense system